MLTRMLAIAALSAVGSGVTAAAAATLPVQVGTLNGLRDLGRAPASVRVQVAVVLNYHHEAELERLVEAQADPGFETLPPFSVTCPVQNVLLAHARRVRSGRYCAAARRLHGRAHVCQ